MNTGVGCHFLLQGISLTQGSNPGLPHCRQMLYRLSYWNDKVGSQETPGVTGKFGLGVQNEAGQRLTEFCQENTLVITNTLFQQHKRRLPTHGHHQMVNIEIKFIIFFAAKEGEALYSQKNKTRN